MPDDQPITDGQPQGHRAGAWVVLLMGIAALALGVYQWHGSFAAAFGQPVTTFKTPDQIEAERIEAMKTKDTDGDGLTDYDETYVYKTSAYLKDSDSDGVDDRAEVTQGGDPNCPKGKSCGTDMFAPALSAPAPAPTSSASGSMDVQQEISTQLLNPTPDQIRALLLQSGMKQEQLQGIDDQTLQSLYQQSLLEAQAQYNNAAPNP